MAAELFKIPFLTAFNSNSLAVPGALLYAYESGTLTAVSTYTAADLATPHSHPVVADSAGRFAPIYLNDAVDYRIIVTDPDGVELMDVDPYTGSAENAAAWGAITGTLSAQTDLQAALDAKQAAGSYAAAAHTHDDRYYTQSEVDALIAAGGSPAWGDITGTLSNQTDLQTALDGKADDSHTHAIGDVTNLQTSLDAKLAAANNLSDLDDVGTAQTNLKLVEISQVDYDALGTPDADTFYFIPEA